MMNKVFMAWGRAPASADDFSCFFLHRLTNYIRNDIKQSRPTHITILFVAPALSAAYFFISDVFLPQCTSPWPLLRNLLLRAGANLVTRCFLFPFRRTPYRKAYETWHFNFNPLAVQRILVIFRTFRFDGTKLPTSILKILPEIRPF